MELFKLASLRLRLSGTTAIFLALAVLVWQAPPANAAAPAVAVVSNGPGQVLVTGTGWPQSPVSVTATVTAGSGAGTVTPDGLGGFKAILSLDTTLPAEAVSVVAQSGTLSAQASGQITSAGTASTANKWNLVFGDDFTGNVVDASKWGTCFHWGCDGANAEKETQTYAAKNVTVSGGAAHLALRKDGSGANPYTSGMLAANANTKVLYGYMEMRAQIADCDGCWPAFWAVPADYTWPPEFDIMEGLDNSSKTVSSNVHWDGGGHQQSGAKKYSPGVDFAAGMHVYGADWTADSITFYVDGKVVNTYKGVGVPKVPMYVIANLAITGNATTGPASMNIDYIRVFQRTGATS